MPADTFSIGLSALRTSQLGISTTGHNIANVNTEGFSRQRVLFDTRPAQFIGVGYVGKGVDTEAIRRFADQFLIDQVQASTANQVAAKKMTELVGVVDRQLGDGILANGLDRFFAAVGDANDDPRHMATRQVLLENAQSLVANFAHEEAQLNDMGRSVNAQITAEIDEINALTRAIANVNIDIQRGAGAAAGEAPNDLLDTRDQLVLELSRIVGVKTQQRADGMFNVLAGNGLILVTGGTQTNLRAIPNPLDVSRVEVAYDVSGTLSQVTDSLAGGELGALIEFRDETLDPARNAIGRLAATMSMTLNAQHREGMDLNGALGGDLFAVSAPQVNTRATNTGTVGVAFDPANVGGLTASDYRLTHDGTNFTLTRLSDNNIQTLAGAGPFNVDGLTITVTSPPAANDEYLIQPTRFAARGMQVAVTNPRDLALALPVRTNAALANVGEATISAPEVLDVTDANLLTTTQLLFNDPPTTFQVNGVGPLIPYTSGTDIDVNGWRVQVTGAPEPGDTFTVQSNAGGLGDNGNGLLLGQMQWTPILEAGTATYQEGYGMLVGEVGSTAMRSRISLDVLSALQENAQITRDELSAVNLDEEAANLLRFQQTYQAATQIIRAAEDVFQALLDAARS